MNKETKGAEYAAAMDRASLHDARNVSPYLDTIAVVGGGAAATSFAYHFGMSVTPEKAQKTYILLFEPRHTIGPGLAYQEDMEALLLNRSSDGMSASAEEPSTFSSWLRWKAHHAEDLRTLSDSDPTATFASRPVFGRFLADFFAEILSRARAKGLHIEVVHEPVQAVERGRRYVIVSRRARHEVDRVVMAVGQPRQRDIYGLTGHPGYVNDPYPVSKHVGSLLRSERVCVIGTGLAAVDIAMALERAGFDGQLDMVSTSGALPFVRGSNQPRSDLRFLSKGTIDALTSSGRHKVGLRSILRLLRRELKEVAVDWRMLFRPDDAPMQTLRDGVRSAPASVAWQQVLASTNHVIEEAWDALDGSAQDLFLRRYNRHWMARRAPMPIGNAQRLLTMLDERRLAVHSGVPVFHQRGREGRIEIELPSGMRRAYDHVINATGARWVDAPEDAPLAWRLLRDGLASRDARGGLRVDFATNALIDATGRPDANLRLLGHLTCGTHLFVTSLEMIARRARMIALDMAGEPVDASRGDRPMSLAA